jgi:hypothetical protein
MNYSNAKPENLALHDRPDLEFPNWNGMKAHHVKMTPAEAFRWNEEMLVLFPPHKNSRRDAEFRCTVEFTL